MTKRLTESEIAISIVPMHRRWPDASAVSLGDRCMNVSSSCTSSREPSTMTALRSSNNERLAVMRSERQRTEVGQEALKKLANFRPLNIAEQAAAKEIETLDEKGGPHTSRGASEAEID